MSLTDRLFRRPPTGAKLDLAALQGPLADAAARAAGRPTDRDLVRARLADGCRDAGVEPPAPEDLDAPTRDFDEEAWRRLGLAVGLLDVEAVRALFPRLAAERGPGELVNTAFVGLARETPLLTAELLRHSPLRVEEFARLFAARLGVRIQGESSEVSRKRLERLDYGRLLDEAERAKRAAEGRVEQLRQLQDEQERRRPRRGKW